jgi:hypothetical protein
MEPQSLPMLGKRSAMNYTAAHFYVVHCKITSEQLFIVTALKYKQTAPGIVSPVS